ncbi:MAG: SpoIIE family protein phosphatase [Kofleriaceae bacterium]|nr:SpoIIE family protein phosphatase [Kofleriaceae bacterium]
MAELGWSWLAAPYLVCSALILAVAIAAALIRGDRVLRTGVIGAAITALPWAVTQAVAACTDDPLVATRLLRLGQGPVVGVGPNLMLVMLAVSGQLERRRWLARVAGLVALVFLVITWTTDWVVPGVQRIPAGMFYLRPGPLTGFALSQLVIWLGVGLVIARRAAPSGERKRMLRLLLGVLVAGAIGSIDTLLLYRVWGIYPLAWLPSAVAAVIALYLVLRTDLLRPQGFDRPIAVELALFGVATAVTVICTLAIGTSHTIALVAITALAWSICSAIAWAISRSRPVRAKAERDLELFMAKVATSDDERKIADRLAGLWTRAIGSDKVGLGVLGVWWVDGNALVTTTGTRWPIDREVAAWLVQHGESLTPNELGTMRVGALRTKLDELMSAHGANLIVPLIDRSELVGLVEATYSKALRDEERVLVAESARAAARALTFAALARAAFRERETAREVEVADALRLQASASRDAELGSWAVNAEYRTAAPTTGAGWSAIELPDGRLALLATEAQAHGVAAALATAALTGAFAAATSGTAKVTLDGLIATMRASSEGVLRGGEPVAAFLAILDAQAQTIDWACAGHPGAFLIGPAAVIPLAPDSADTPVEGASLTEATRGQTPYHPDMLLVVASTALRAPDPVGWQKRLGEVAPATGRLASVLVETTLRAGAPAADLLALVVRSR